MMKSLTWPPSSSSFLHPPPPTYIFLFFFFCLILLHLLIKALNFLWLNPKKTEHFFCNQGLRGPPYRFIFGNLTEMVSMMLEASSKPMIPPYSHNILPRVLSFYHHWKKAYGSTFLLWFGPTPRLTIADPELIREIFITRAADFDRYEAHPLIRQLEGEGLVNLRGAKWALHRKLISPVFHMDNLKLLMPAIGEKMASILDKLSEAAKSSGEVELDVADWYQSLTEETITRLTFGRSYDQGKSVLKLQTKLMVFAADAFNRVFIPGYRFLPTEKNRRRWKLDKDIRDNLFSLVDCRREKKEEKAADAGEAKDLLGQMTAAAAADITVNDVVEECKTFFFAGKQTTTNLLTWTTVLLAMHPEWQDLAREELLRVCGSRDLPSKDDLPKLKTMGMIVNETLRLYPPAVATIRQAKADVALGGYVVPRGTEILVPIIAIHHDAGLWGPDVARFNPNRFEDGVSRAARHPNAFMPFGLGQRMCVGRALAVLEAKLALAAVLRRFEIRVSPNYVHAPTVLMMLYPQYGAPVIFRPICAGR